MRRIWIPKPGKTEKRPLGIPTMTDRAKQALAKLVLEPEWEAKFEQNSYGFRPARSCQDAIRAIHTAINHKNAYVLDADIKGCFDNIDHVALLEKLRTFPKLRKVIKGWLRAGVMEGNVFQATRNGTPQGGIISPLLANVALHGLEYETKEALLEYLLKYYKEYKGQANKERAKRALHIIRYADDFVMIHESKEIILKAKEFVEKWFEHIGLKLSNEKTRITYTLKNKEKEKSGFDFLGFQIIQYPNNKRARKYITIAKPSSGSQKRHKKLISIIFKQSAAATQKELIEKLNPIIRGWCNYFRSGASSKTFGYMNYFMFHKLWKWARWRHPNKGLRWIKSKYFRGYKRDTWSFITPDNIRLVRHCEFYIKRHVKIIGTNTPYDGNLNYWAKRLNDGKAMSINKLAERCI